MSGENGQHEAPCITIPMTVEGMEGGPKQIRVKEVSLTAVPAANDAQRWQLAAALCLEAAKLCVEEMRKQLAGEEPRVKLANKLPRT